MEFLFNLRRDSDHKWFEFLEPFSDHELTGLDPLGSR
jgi:hypothetical protein